MPQLNEAPGELGIQNALPEQDVYFQPADVELVDAALAFFHCRKGFRRRGSVNTVT